MDAPKIILNDPEGNPVETDEAGSQQLLQQGYTPPSQEQLDILNKQEQMQSPKEQLRTGVQEFASALSFGASKGVQRLLGDNPEDIAARPELNPISGVAGEAAGLAAGLGLNVASNVANKFVGDTVAKTALGRVGSAATKAAIENAAIQEFKEVGKFFGGDPHQTVETALADIGLAAAVGGAFGGGIKGAGELWDMSAGKSIESVLNSVKNRANGVPEGIRTAANIELPAEVNAALGDNEYARQAAQTLAESTGKRGAEFRASMQQVQDNIGKGALESMGRTADDIPRIADISKAQSGAEFKKGLETVIKERIEPIEAAYNKFEEQFKKSAIAPETRLAMQNEISQLIVDNGLLKGANDQALAMAQKTMANLDKQATAQDLRVYAQGLMEQAPYGSEKYQAAKQLRNILDKGRELTVEQAAGSTNLSGAFKQTQAAYAGFKGILQELNDRLHLGKGAERGKSGFLQRLKEMDPETIANRLKLKEDSGLQKLLAEHFPEVNNIVKQQELNNLLEKSLNSAKDSLDIKKLQRNIFGMEPELRANLFNPEQLARIDALGELSKRIPTRMNPSGTARTMDALYGHTGASALGVATAVMSGNPIIGVIVGALGQHLKTEIPDAVRMSILKFLGSNQEINARGFSGMLKLAGSLVRAEKRTIAAAKNVFSSDGEEITMKTIDTDKLSKMVDQYMEHPEKLMDMQNDVGHYMPDHGAVVSMAAARNLQYLASLRPVEQQLTPLSQKLVASKEQEQKYQNALIIAQQPLVLMNKVKRGTITVQDLKHLQALYPAYHQNMQSKLNDQMVHYLSMGKNLPYKTKIGLSVFMGQPMDNSLQQPNIMAAQPLPQAPPAGPTGNQRSRQNPQLDKVYKSEALPSQSREANKHR